MAPRFLFIVVLAVTAVGCAGPTEQARREPPLADTHTIKAFEQARREPPAVDTHAVESPEQARREPPVVGTHAIKTFDGIACWYGREHHGRRTANGERFNMYAYTAAHRELPFGTRVRVTNLRNGRDAVVRINDRGPFVRGRVIDLSYIAARDLGMLETGLEEVRLEILDE